MARLARIHHPGCLYHVMLRGNDRQEIFFGDEDRDHFFQLVGEGVERYGYRVHAYCCMTNHVHLALQVSDVPLSRCMQNLAFRYTRWINRKLGRVGHLFQGRYKAIVVDADSYLAELVRYVHLNPVRAGMVKAAGEFPWSSHRAYLGGTAVPWLTTDWVLSQFSERAGIARRRYEAFVNAGLTEGHRDEFHRGIADARILGDDRFVDKLLARPEVERRVPVLREVIAAVCKEYGVRAADLASPGQQRSLSHARAVTAWLAVKLKCANLTAASRSLGRDVTTISSAVRRLETRARRSRAVAKSLRKLQSTWSV